MDVVGHLELLAACMDSGQMDLAPVILEGMMKEVSSLFVEDVEVRFSPDCSFSFFFRLSVSTFVCVCFWYMGSKPRVVLMFEFHESSYPVAAGLSIVLFAVIYSVVSKQRHTHPYVNI
jgi:hypothetical protein